MDDEFKHGVLFYELVILSGLAMAHKSVIIPNLRLIVTSFNATYGYGGLLVGLYMFFSSIASLGWALYSDYTGAPRKFLIALGFGGGVFFTLISYYLYNPVTFALFYILAGMSLSVVFPLSTTILMDITKQEERTTALMSFGVISGFGYAVGYGIGVVMASTTGCWRYPLIVILFLIALMGIPLALVIREPPKGMSEKVLEPVIKRVHRYPFTLRPEDIEVITTNKSNYYLTLQGIFGIIASGAIEVWLIQYLITEAGASEVVAVLFLGLGALGSILGIGLAKLTDRLYLKNKTARPLMAAFTSITESILFLYFLMTPISVRVEAKDFISSLIDLLVLIYSNKALLMSVVLVFVAMFLGAPNGSIKASIISEVNLPEHRATVVSGIGILEMFSKSIGIIALGFLIDIFHNIRIPLMIAVSMWIISGIFWYKLSRHVVKDIWKMNLMLNERKKLLGDANEV